MQNIVITGCSTGIGLATANYLQTQGYKVYPTVRKPDDVQRLKAMGFEHVMLLDVTQASHITKVIESVLKQDGKIDTWFNNAGYGQPGAIEDLSTTLLKEQFETNVFGLYECTRQVLPIMRQQGYGKIIQHSSVLGLVSLIGRGAYNASKYAVEGLTDTLRLELKETNVYAVLLNTGPIESAFRDNAMRKLEANIDIENSNFKKPYTNTISGDASKVPFKLSAEAVAKVVHQITLAKKPKPRYYITKATYLLGYLKRILSTSMLDSILKKI